MSLSLDSVKSDIARFFSNDSDSIPALKARLRDAILSYRSATAHLDCGAHMAAHISPGVGRRAREINEIAAKLQKLDPDFPKSFTPYPEGT